MRIQLPVKVDNIIKTLEAAGYEAFAVGGCIRDSVLGRTPQDWDITTSAKPQDVKRLFSHTIDTGIQHGTVTVMLEHEGFEVTTYRIDGEYEDARHPKEVTYTVNLLEDLKRRDFTINAMAYNESRGLVDAFDGMGDLQKKVIRCVGNPKERFTEDALRMLRALRFAAQLGFEVEEQTFAAIRELAQTIEKISAERIQTELVKLLTSDHPELIREVYTSGISDVILPEFSVLMQTEQNNPHHCYTVGEHTIHVVQQVENQKVLRLAALFHDIAKPVCKTTDETGVDHFYGHPKEGAKMADPILVKLLAEAALQAAKDSEGKNRLLAIILGPVIFLLLLVALVMYLATSPFTALSEWLVGDEIAAVDEFQKDYGYNNDSGIFERDFKEADGQEYDEDILLGREGETQVVYYNQLDDRWADEPYGQDKIGTHGCGPTSMSIVVSTLTGTNVDPVEMAQWSYENGYYCPGGGSYHSMIPKAAEHWGLSVDMNLDGENVADALAAGKLVVAIMSKGHFTKSGHFIVLRGITADGKVLVADPASLKRSNQEWDLSLILEEAKKRVGAGGPFWAIYREKSF